MSKKRIATQNKFAIRNATLDFADLEIERKTAAILAAQEADPLSVRSIPLSATKRKAAYATLPSAKSVDQELTGRSSGKKGDRLAFDRAQIKEAETEMLSTMISTDRRDYLSLKTEVSEPWQVGVFSEMHSGRIQTFDNRELKAFRPPLAPDKITNEQPPLERDAALINMNLNLSAGIDSWIQWDDSVKKHNNRLFNWILHNREILRRSIVRPSLLLCCQNAEFVCSRDLLVDLASSLYGQSGWVINVVRWQNVFFLVKAPTPPNDDKTGLFMTDKLRNLVTCDVGTEEKPWNNPGDLVDSRARFSAVFRANVSSASNTTGHRLLYTGGIDCVDENDKFVAVKVGRALKKGNLFNFYRVKMLNLFLRCFFTGIDRLVIGFHTPAHTLVQLGEFDVEQIPTLAQSALNEKAWDTSVCMNFLDSFLSELKQQILANDISAVYQIAFSKAKDRGGRGPDAIAINRLMSAGEFETGFEYLQSIAHHCN